MTAGPRIFLAPRRSAAAGHPEHPGRDRRRGPVPTSARDLRDVPIPPPPGPPPAGVDGTRMVWAPWSGEWQVLEAPCELCDQVAPARPGGLCRRCEAIAAGFTLNR